MPRLPRAKTGVAAAGQEGCGCKGTCEQGNETGATVAVCLDHGGSVLFAANDGLLMNGGFWQIGRANAQITIGDSVY